MLWGTMRYHVQWVPCGTMGHYGVLWGTMGYYEALWGTMRYYGVLKVLWVTMRWGIYAVLWGTTRDYFFSIFLETWPGGPFGAGKQNRNRHML